MGVELRVGIKKPKKVAKKKKKKKEARHAALKKNLVSNR